MAPVAWLPWLLVVLLAAGRSDGQPMPSVALLLSDVDSVLVDDVQRTFNATNATNVQVVDVSGYSPYQLVTKTCQLAGAGVVAVVTQTACSALVTLASVADSFALALVAEQSVCERSALDRVVAVVSEEEEYMLDTGTVLVRTHVTDVMDHALYDVLMALGWNDIIVVYEEHDDMADHLKNLDVVLDAMNGTVQMLKVSEATLLQDVHDILDFMVNNPKHSRVVTLCGTRCVNELMYQANMLDHAGFQQAHFSVAVHWLVLTHTEELAAILANVSELNHVTALTPPEHQDVQMSMVGNLVNIANLTSVYINKIPQWEWESKAIPCGSRLKIDRNIAKELEFNITEAIDRVDIPFMLYAAIWKPRGARLFEPVAEWKSEELNHFTIDDIFPNVNRGLNAKHMMIGTNIWSPFVRRDANSTHDYVGYCIDLLVMLSVQYNFSFTLIEPEDGEWGVYKNGSYTGLVGQLQRKEVDMVFAPLGFSINRSMYVDFTNTFFIEFQTVLVEYPDPSKSNWRIYLDPFMWDVWTGIVIAIPIAAIILWAFHRLTPCYSEEEKRKGMGSLQESLWYSFGSFLTQGSDILPDAQSARFVVGFWLMYCLVVIASYSGNLVAFFTVSNPTVPFNDLKEMVNSSYKFGLLSGTHTYSHIMDSTSGTFKKIADSITEFNETDPAVLSYSHKEHLAKVRSDKYAYIVDHTAATMETSFNCSLDTIKEVFIPLKYSVALQNNSGYRALLNEGLDSLTENGLTLRWRQKWWPQSGACDRGLVTASKPVSLSDMQGAFFLMAMVLALAMLTLFVELGVTKHKQRIQTNLRELEQAITPQREVRYYQYENNYGPRME